MQMEYLKATILFLLFTSEIGLAERHLVPITLQSSHYKSYGIVCLTNIGSVHFHQINTLPCMMRWNNGKGGEWEIRLQKLSRVQGDVRMDNGIEWIDTSTLVLPIKGSTIAIETKTSQ
jgi:hypothetical protein